MGIITTILRSFLGGNNLRSASVDISYKERLRAFNSTEKYFNELTFLQGLIDLQRSDKALDYGCGLGTAMKSLHEKTGHYIYGFDVTNDLYEWDEFYFRKQVWFQFQAVYFMHSFSHIPNAYDLLERVSDTFLENNGRLVIISPNPEWLALQNNESYVKDPTVVKHYSLDELKQIVTDAGLKVVMSGQFGEKCGEVNERIFIKAIK